MTKKNNKYSGYIGTYTKGDSKGIYSFTLDTEAAKILDVKLAAELENPTYVNISKDNRFLYAVKKEGENGGVAAFAIQKSGELTPINSQLAGGSSPCHVSVDSQSNVLFSGNYHKGEVASYLLDAETGSISPAVSVIQHEGSGPDPRQEKPHTHYAGLTPDENYLAVVELGIDALITYSVASDGTLTRANLLPLKGGSGPRHLAFHPNGKYAYIMTEFSSEVVVLSYYPEDGHFTEKQYISTLPEDFTENNQGSAIHISSDGRFVYAGNRGHNSIAVFRVDAFSGELSFVEHVSTEGDWPRDFALDPSEKFIVASNQESGNLVLFSRDDATGRLTLLESDVSVPYPVCVKFLHS
ncbi:lactonase family protein [Neobacillus sp. MM2021_6]|uniref:lactonase family protein n=1 Tax=Bacillaceae TaxID=186817 RepID=UPI0014077AD4|nr:MULTISPECIES: lactonase family protein [Bacillaceae]MBO0962192.1 lactonase family protein [Neobacillus sp. MM2021_6]NHC19028.1 lactonase family protein [Bacillus sp. MM2020_4]